MEIRSFSDSSPISHKFKALFGSSFFFKENDHGIVFQESQFLLNVFLDSISFAEQGVLHGSYLIGTAKENSDIDIIVLCSFEMYKQALKKSPSYVMESIKKGIASKLIKNYELTIDYPSITILNRETKTQYDFTPIAVFSADFYKKSVYKGRYAYFINNDKIEEGIDHVFCERNKFNKLEKSDLLDVHTNFKIKLINKMVHYWLNCHSPIYDDIPKYIFYDLISAHAKEDKKESFQQIFNDVLIRMSIELGFVNHRLNLGALKNMNELSNKQMATVHNASNLSSEAIRLEEKGEFDKAINNWNLVFNENSKL